MTHIARKIRKIFLDVFYRKLWTQLAVILTVIVTIPIIWLGCLLINTSNQAVTNVVLNSNKQIVKRAASEIKLFISHPKMVLNTTAALLGVAYPEPWKQETILVELVINEPLFIRAYTTDIYGEIIASSELGTTEKQINIQDIIKRIVQDKVYLSEVKFLDNRNPFLTIAVPIIKSTKWEGILIADINLIGIWDIVDNIRVGKTGRAFLITSDGRLIAHPDKKRVLKNEITIDKENIQGLLSKGINVLISRGDLKERLIRAYAVVPEIGWLVFFEQTYDEAFAYSEVMKMQSWIIIILSELAAIIISIFMAQFLVKPIKTLVSKIRLIIAGDLDHKIETRRGDEIGDLVKSFNKMIEKLRRTLEQERLSAIGEVSIWVAHELKNSMVAIKSFVQLFPRKHNDLEFVETFNKLVPKEIARWEKLLKELSGFSSQLEMNPKKIDLAVIIKDLIAIMKEKLKEKKIKVQVNFSNGPFNIIGDPEKIEQVFLNLIINAMQAMEDKEGLLNISLLGRFDSGSIEVRITDTGRGIDNKMINKIFEPFYSNNNKEGLGLGLTISRRIVEQHGGRIAVESIIGKGSTFIINFPVNFQRR